MRGRGIQGTARNREYTPLCPWTCALTPRQVSCICIALFACQHAFRAREPLPQFLPSSRHALRTLEDHVHARLQQAREEDPDALGLSAVYAFAEQQVLRSLIDTLEAKVSTTTLRDTVIKAGVSVYFPSEYGV